MRTIAVFTIWIANLTVITLIGLFHRTGMLAPAESDPYLKLAAMLLLGAMVLSVVLLGDSHQPPAVRKGNDDDDSR